MRYKPFLACFLQKDRRHLFNTNVMANWQLDNITLIKGGAGAKNSLMTGRTGQNEIDEGYNIRRKNVLYTPSTKFCIKIYSLASILNKIKKNNALVLKLDAEGAEYDIITEANAELLKKFEQIIIEYHYGLKGMVSLLRKSGFQVRYTKPMRDYNLKYDEFTELGFIFAEKQTHPK